MLPDSLAENPPKADIAKDIYRPFPAVPQLPTDANNVAAAVVANVFAALMTSLESGNALLLGSLFFREQAYWRDCLALTYHLRTFNDVDAITSAMLDLAQKRGMRKIQIVEGSLAVRSAGPTLSWMESMFTFDTGSPNANCHGKITLLPEYDDYGTLTWKIWLFSTWLVEFNDFPEDISRLDLRANLLGGTTVSKTEVLIIGAGNSGLILAARLKALAVDYILIDKSRRIGDNWALRYDSLRFHTPKGFSEMPYIRYPENAPYLLHRSHLVEQVRRFAKVLNLEDRIFLETTATSTSYNASEQTWLVKLNTGKTVICKHLVLATGILSSTPHVPSIEGKGNYCGVDIHSVEFKNAALLKERRVKSVVIVGSGNTAFDVVHDCHKAGLETTMIQRSPTYVMPVEYWTPQSLGLYDSLPPEVADVIVFSAPYAVGGQMLGQVHANLAAKESGRYSELKEAGFQVMDSTQADLMVHILGRQGGHYIDIGGTELIASRKVGIRSGVTPVSYTTTGLQLSDESVLESDAIIWCTGFRDVNVRNVVDDILGEGGKAVQVKMEPTWGLDSEGETRGMYKRQQKLEGFWVVGGGAGHQRWYSKVVALQIKGSLEGILPEPYLE